MKVKRIAAILIDYFIISWICITPFLLILVKTNYQISNIKIYLLMGCMLLFLILKDIPFRNASIGKKILGLEIVDSNGKKPSFLIIILRNIFLILWPIEAIIFVISGKRLGDIIFKTQIIENSIHRQNIAIQLRRLLAGMIDLYIIEWIVPPICSFAKILGVEGKVEIVTFQIIIIIGSFLMKDLIFKNQSLGKKICKIAVVNKETSDIPTQKALVLRNITLLLLPLELIYIIGKNERLGDKLFKTKIVEK